MRRAGFRDQVRPRGAATPLAGRQVDSLPVVDTRQEILDVATGLFIEQGYEKTSLREIAERIGVTKAALYYHFPSKQQILEALVTPAFGMLGGAVERWKAARGDLDAWEESITEVVDWMLEHPRLFVLIDRTIEVIQQIELEHATVDAHQFHRSVEELMADAATPIADRLRMVGSLGAVTAMFTFGGRVPDDVPVAQVREILLAVVRVILRSDLGDAAARVTAPPAPAGADR
jgi:AcrR family transcriptional regulator